MAITVYISDTEVEISIDEFKTAWPTQPELWQKRCGCQWGRDIHPVISRSSEKTVLAPIGQTSAYARTYSHLHVKLPMRFKWIRLNSPAGLNDMILCHNLAGRIIIRQPIVTLFGPAKEFRQNMLAVWHANGCNTTVRYCFGISRTVGELYTFYILLLN
jgi:hypothetical protein